MIKVEICCKIDIVSLDPSLINQIILCNHIKILGLSLKSQNNLGPYVSNNFV